MRRRLAVFLLAAASLAQWQTTPPRAGYVVDREGRLRAVWGVAGNFIVGEARLEGVISSASSRAWTLVKREGELILLDASGAGRARYDAPRGPALFAFDEAGAPALAYFPDERLLCRLRGETLEPVRTVEHEVAGIARLDDERFLALVRDAGGLEIVEFTHAPGSPGTPVETLPWAGPALIPGRGELVVADGARVHLRSSDGALTSFDLPAPVSALNLMSDEWVEAVTADSARFALRIGAARPGAYALPEVLR